MEKEMKNSLSGSSLSLSMDQYLIDVSIVLEKEVRISSVNDVPLFTLGNLSTITGKAKSRKTFFASAIAASIISGECLGIKSENRGLVLYLDTEQSKYDVQRVAKRILRLSALSPEENSPSLAMYALRPLSVEERIEKLKATIETHKPVFVVIDGIRDLLHDFNNIAESSSLVSLIMRLSTENRCNILSVLHQNKADSNMRGHAGSELLNKSETVLEVSTTNEITVVKAIASRGMSPSDIYFQISNSGLPVPCNAPTTEDTKTENVKEIMRRCIGQSSMTYQKLKEEYMEKAGLSDRSAKRHISDMVRDNLIEKDKQRLYRIKRPTSGLATDDLPPDEIDYLPH